MTSVDATGRGPRSGDKVRVVVEGTYRERAGHDHGDFRVEYDDHFHSFARRAVVSVEVLAPPEPSWEIGDVVRDADGAVLFYRGHDALTPWADANSMLRDVRVPRPLTLLVRGGEIVGGASQ